MKRYQKFLIVLLVLISIPILWLTFFVVSTEAPIIVGEVVYDVPFNEDHKLDIYTPTNHKYEKSPTVLFIHGGGWIGGSKEAININRYNGAVNTLRDSGYTVISINYTLAHEGQSPFPDCILDAVDAVEWIESNADTFNLDLNNFGLFGESAGAHIALMLLHSDLGKLDSIHVKPDYDYIVDVYGPSRLEGIYHSALVDTFYQVIEVLPESFRSRLDIASYLFGFDPKEDSLRAAEHMEMYSPYNFVHGNSPPTLLISGKVDQVVPLEQTTSLQAKLESLGVENEMHILPNVNHGFIDATPEQMDSVQQWISSFVIQQYNP